MEAEPAGRPLRKPSSPQQAREAPSVPGPYVRSPTGVFPVTSQPKARIEFLPPLWGYKYQPLRTPLPPPPPTWPRRGLSISASCLCPSSEHPRSRRRGPPASRGRTPFPPPLPAQKGVLSHEGGGGGGKEAQRGRRGAEPNNPFHQPAPSTCSVSSRDSGVRDGWRGQPSRSSVTRREDWVQYRVTPLRRYGAQTLSSARGAYGRAPLCY